MAVQSGIEQSDPPKLSLHTHEPQAHFPWPPHTCPPETGHAKVEQFPLQSTPKLTSLMHVQFPLVVLHVP